MNARRYDCCGLALFGLLVCLVAPSVAADSQAAAETDSVDDAFRSIGSVPWYDAESGEVAPIRVSPRIDDSANRDSRWSREPDADATDPESTSSTDRDQSDSTANVFGWIAVTLFMCGVVGLLVYAYLRIDGDDPAAEGAASRGEGDADLPARLEKLPVDVRRPAGDLLEEADRLAALGRIDEAIVYLFGHRLLQLDRHHAIRLARGKTNRQYLSELRGWPELRRIMRETVDLFEASYFGRYQVSAAQFTTLRAGQGELESLLTNLREAA